MLIDGASVSPDINNRSELCVSDKEVGLEFELGDVKHMQSVMANQHVLNNQSTDVYAID